jgi:hypothetical protein
VALNNPVGNITPDRHAARFAAEKQKLAHGYCEAFKFWRACPLRRCRKSRRCDGEALGCLRRRVDEVPRIMQWQARQRIMAATPPDTAAPERTARELMPNALADAVIPPHVREVDGLRPNRGSD